MFRPDRKTKRRTATNSRDVLAIRLFLAYLLVTAAIGGASRGDEFVLVFLRPIGIALGAVALWMLPWRRFGPGWPITAAVVGVAILCMVQLIPLPPGIWSELPGRAEIVAIDTLLFDELPWRPLTLSPKTTYNALFYALSLTGGLLIANAAAAQGREATILRAILAIAALNVALCILEAQMGGKIFKPYRLMSPAPSGLFTNANHSGVFCAIGMLVGARLAAMRKLTGGQATQWFLFAGIALLMLVGAFLSTSRLAFAAAGIATICSTLIFLRDVVFTDSDKGRFKAVRSAKARWIVSGAILAAAAVLIAAFIYLAFVQREVSMGNFEEASMAESLRVRLVPILGAMVSDHWLAGIGYGSFADYYAIVEPPQYVGPQYVNQAHNDFAQFVIEGGIVAAFIALAASAWLMARLIGLFRAGYTNRAIVVTGVLAIVASGSALDYVLRTPLFAFSIAALLIVWLTAGDKTKDANARRTN